MYNLKSVRLQPIVDLRDKKTFGYEVLSELPSGRNKDVWFHYRTPDQLLRLCHWQLQLLEGFAMKETLFLNLSVEALLRPGIEKELVFRCKEIIIELQDPEALLIMSSYQLGKLRQKLSTLSLAGISVWLDDYRPVYDIVLDQLSWHFAGIKIDRHIFHELCHQQTEFNKLVNNTRRYGRRVLVEGIETAADLFIAIQSPVDFAQGYFWSELRITAAI